MSASERPAIRTEDKSDDPAEQIMLDYGDDVRHAARDHEVATLQAGEDWRAGRITRERRDAILKAAYDELAGRIEAANERLGTHPDARRVERVRSSMAQLLDTARPRS